MPARPGSVRVGVRRDFPAAEMVLLKRSHVLVFVEHGAPGFGRALSPRTSAKAVKLGRWW